MPAGYGFRRFGTCCFAIKQGRNFAPYRHENTAMLQLSAFYVRYFGRRPYLDFSDADWWRREAAAKSTNGLRSRLSKHFSVGGQWY
jgi:hypothetical protein